jgi:microcystin-dependent protein
MNYYLGEIIAFAGPYVPQDFLACNGAVLSIANNELLYSLLGTTYGGDGVTTFALPKLDGLVVVGTGVSATNTDYVLGKTGGATTVELNTSNLPLHNHSVMASTTNATTGDPKSKYLAASVPGTNSTYTGVQIYDVQSDGVLVDLNAKSVQTAGSGQPHQNLMPYLTINYIICSNGYYPPQD